MPAQLDESLPWGAPELSNPESRPTCSRWTAAAAADVAPCCSHRGCCQRRLPPCVPVRRQIAIVHQDDVRRRAQEELELLKVQGQRVAEWAESCIAAGNKYLENIQTQLGRCQSLRHDLPTASTLIRTAC